MNANQRRSIEAMLESVEATLYEIERLMPDATDAATGVTAISNDLPERFHLHAPDRIAELRSQLSDLAQRIHLSRRKVSKRRAVRGMLTAQMVRLEDITPARLKSYGEVHSSFSEEITPGLMEMRASLHNLLALLQDGTNE